MRMRPRPLGPLPFALAALAALAPAAEADEPAAQPAPAEEPAQAPAAPAPALTPAPVPAVEQPQPEVARTYSPGSYASPRQMAGDNLLMPDGDIEVGGELAFVTSDGAPAPASELEFTDMAFFRARVRRSIKRKAELLLGVTLLPKQPSFTDESIFQSGSLGLRTAAGRKWALNVGGAGGLQVDQDGWWFTASGGAQTKRRMHETLTFDLAAGVSYIRYADETVDPWLVEVGFSGDVLLHTPHNEVGLWIGATYSVPVVHLEESGLFDPQPRLDFRLGLVYALIERWDLWVELQVVDRGDSAYPATTLPILDGGFDQQQLVFGIIRRFSKKPADRGSIWLAI